MSPYDITKLEAVVDRLRAWLYRRRGNPSHWFGLLGAANGAAVAGAAFTVAHQVGGALGIAAGIAAAAIVDGLVGVVAGERSED